jgi:hypothetical protein
MLLLEFIQVSVFVFYSSQGCIGSGKELDFDVEFIKVTFDFISESAFGIAFNAVEDTSGDHTRFLQLFSNVLNEANQHSLNPLRKYVRLIASFYSSSSNSVF